MNTLFTYKFIVACQEATQSINELSETYKSIKNRYHPIIWWLLSLFK